MIKYITLLLIAPCIFSGSLKAQERKFIYDVMKNGKVIGEINLVEMVQGQKKFLSMVSDVKTTVVFPFTDHTAETAAFDKGVMVYSSFNQKQTGSDEVNKTTKVNGKSYKITDGGKTKVVNMAPIRYNMLLLYTNMPKGITKVYSANFQKFLDIKKLAENLYRLTLPDGKVNDYYYKNGICTKVEIVRSLFTIQFVLRQ